MGELSNKLLAWLARLLPKQTVHGDDAVQVGHLKGDLHLDRSTNSSALHVTHVTQHIYVPAPVSACDQTAANDSPMTPEQREVLALMRQLRPRAYNQVVSFMRRELGTGLVRQLHGQQLYRVRRYVDTIQRNEEEERA